MFDRLRKISVYYDLLKVFIPQLFLHAAWICCFEMWTVEREMRGQPHRASALAAALKF